MRLVDPSRGTLAPGVTISKIRQLTLNEVMGMPMGEYEGGPLEVLVNGAPITQSRPICTPLGSPVLPEVNMT